DLVRKDLCPPPLVEDLDAVRQIELAFAQTLGQHPHHGALEGPGTRKLPVDEGRRREIGDKLRQRPPYGREELEQLAEARGRVIRGQEIREDVAASFGAGQADSILSSSLM